MRNSSISETSLIDIAFSDIIKRLPPQWRLRNCERYQTVGARAGSTCVSEIDALWEIQDSLGVSTTVVVEVKVNPVQPNLVSFVSEKLWQLTYSVEEEYGNSDATPVPFLISSFLSPLARERFEAAGISYADSTGNLRFFADRPAVFIQTQGADRNPFRESRALRSLKGGRAARAVRAFLDYRPPFGTRELADETRNSPATISRVADLLERDAIISRDGPRGRIVSVDWETLARRWAMDYDFANTNKLTTWLEPRGTRALMERLRDTDIRYAATGSFAAFRFAPVAEPRLLSLYTEDPESDTVRLGLRPADTGGNILIGRPFDPVVFERTQCDVGIIYARVTQVLVDLMTGPGRAPAEAEGLLEWMRNNEEAWRLLISSKT